MLRLVLILLGILVAVILVVVCTGSLLPQHHTATRSRAFTGSPEQVFGLISGPQDWRTDLKEYKFFEDSGQHMVRETDKHGQTITYQIVQSQPPTLLKRTIADRNLPFGGSWTWQVQPQANGSLLTITEDGEVYNPVFRFVSKFILGHTRTMDNYLAMLSTALDKQNARAAGAR